MPQGTPTKNGPLSQNPPRWVHGPTPLLAFMLAFLLPPLGLLLSVWALIKVVKNRQKGRALAVAGIVISTLLCLGMALIFSLLASIGGVGHSNQAESIMKPIEAKITTQGGKKICENGDNGYTLDNTVPWHTVYYSMSSATIARQQVQDAANQSGFSLLLDNERIDNLKTGNNISVPNVESYSTNNDYLLATNPESQGNIRVEIIRSGRIALDCKTGKYGEPKSPDPGGAIVFMSLSLPSTR